MPLSRCAWPLVAWLAAGLAAPAAAGCSVAASPVAFGVIDTARNSRGAGEVVVRCDAPAEFRVGLSPGGEGGEERRMRGPGGARLTYFLFADPGYSIPWGDGRAIGSSRAGRSDGEGPVRLTVHGIIPPQPGTPEGDYQDSLEVTLTF